MGHRIKDSIQILYVSIPERDFSWFQPYRHGLRIWELVVSIPERDFSWFQQMIWQAVLSDICKFQSLKGILVDFNGQIVPPVLINSKVFQSLKGILVDFNFAI